MTDKLSSRYFSCDSSSVNPYQNFCHTFTSILFCLSIDGVPSSVVCQNSIFFTDFSSFFFPLTLNIFALLSDILRSRRTVLGCWSHECLERRIKQVKTGKCRVPITFLCASFQVEKDQEFNRQKLQTIRHMHIQAQADYEVSIVPALNSP